MTTQMVVENPIVDTPEIKADEPIVLSPEDSLRVGLERKSFQKHDSWLHEPDEQIVGLLRESGLRPYADSDRKATSGDIRRTRRRFIHLCRELDMPTRRRLLHLWQMHSMSPATAIGCAKYVGLTFMPGPVSSRFEALPVLSQLAAASAQSVEDLILSTDPEVFDLTSRAGICWVDLHQARALTLSRQTWRNSGGKESWRLDVFGFWLDEQGRLQIGGLEVKGAWSKDHQLYWADLGPLPGRGEDPGQLTKKFVGTYEAGLDLACAVERATLGNEGVEPRFTWPRAWVGYENDDAFTPEVMTPTQALKYDALNWVNSWLTQGKPHDPVLTRSHGMIDQDSFMSWQALRSCVGNVEALNILEQTWCNSQFFVDELYWTPLDYFRPGSLQRPQDPQNHTRVILSFNHKLMGREVLDPTGQQVQDPLLSRTQVAPCGRRDNQPALASVMIGQTESTGHTLLFRPSRRRAA